MSKKKMVPQIHPVRILGPDEPEPSNHELHLSHFTARLIADETIEVLASRRGRTGTYHHIPMKSERPPILMILHCPECRARHVDGGEWATKQHHTHACQSCGFVWRPAVEHTVGVQHLPGFQDAPWCGKAAKPSNPSPAPGRPWELTENSRIVLPGEIAAVSFTPCISSFIAEHIESSLPIKGVYVGSNRVTRFPTLPVFNGPIGFTALANDCVSVQVENTTGKIHTLRLRIAGRWV